MMQLIEEKRKIFINFVNEVTEQIFKVSLVTFLFLFLLDQLVIGFVSRKIDLSIFLIIILASGIVTFSMQREDKKRSLQFMKIDKKMILLIFTVAIISALIIYYQLRGFGTIAYIVALCVGIVVLLTITYIIKEGIDNSKAA